MMNAIDYINAETQTTLHIPKVALFNLEGTGFYDELRG